MKRSLLTSFSQSVRIVTHSKIIVCITVPPIIPDQSPFKRQKINYDIIIKKNNYFSYLNNILIILLNINGSKSIQFQGEKV